MFPRSILAFEISIYIPCILISLLLFRLVTRSLTNTIFRPPHSVPDCFHLRTVSPSSHNTSSIGQIQTRSLRRRKNTDRYRSLCICLRSFARASSGRRGVDYRTDSPRLTSRDCPRHHPRDRHSPPGLKTHRAVW